MLDHLLICLAGLSCADTFRKNSRGPRASRAPHENIENVRILFMRPLKLKQYDVLEFSFSYLVKLG